MQRWIDKAVRVIVELYAPEQIILFGSCAMGNPTLHSDVDLLIIKQSHLPRLYRGLEVIEHLQRYPIKFDLLFYTPDEVQAGLAVEHSFMNTVHRSGVVIYQQNGVSRDSSK